MAAPILAEDLGEVLALVLIELMVAVSSSSAEADEHLERIAGRLLDAVAGLVDGPPREALRSIAYTLIKTEGGTV